jgi:hypothetical protein
VIPPRVKRTRNPAAKYSGVRSAIEPRNSVATQLSTLTPVGTAIAIEESMKNTSTALESGVANMWWAHTSIDRNAIAMLDAAIAL